MSGVFAKMVSDMRRTTARMNEYPGAKVVEPPDAVVVVVLLKKRL